jgi:hypothetical protein
MCFLKLIYYLFVFFVPKVITYQKFDHKAELEIILYFKNILELMGE